MNQKGKVVVSSEGKLIGICQNPHSEQVWFEAKSTNETCPMECDCQPVFYRPASEVERLREARGEAPPATADVSSEGKRWTLVRREAEPGHESGRWRVDYDSERLWGFEYEVVVPASEVERLQERLRISVDKTPVEAFISEIAQLHALGLPPTQSDINRLLRDTGLDAALHPDEPKEKG